MQVKAQVLRMEVSVLSAVARMDAPCRHFCRIYGRGRTDLYNYVAMTLVASSLQVRARTLAHTFTGPSQGASP